MPVNYCLFIYCGWGRPQRSSLHKWSDSFTFWFISCILLILAPSSVKRLTGAVEKKIPSCYSANECACSGLRKAASSPTQCIVKFVGFGELYLFMVLCLRTITTDFKSTDFTSKVFSLRGLTLCWLFPFLRC